MNPSVAQDPVAGSIETYLQEQAAAGYGPFEVCAFPDEVTVTFGSVTSRGETGEIALVRLARVLLDDKRFAPDLMQRLRDRA